MVRNHPALLFVATVLLSGLAGHFPVVWFLKATKFYRPLAAGRPNFAAWIGIFERFAITLFVLLDSLGGAAFIFGLKTAVIHQSERFWDGTSERSLPNLAASFQKAAIDILVDRALAAAEDNGLRRIVAGGGVAANSYLRERLAAESGVEVIFPSLTLCTDNAAMVAGFGYHALRDGKASDFSLNAEARVRMFKRKYP